MKKMKKFTNSIKALAVLLLVLSAKISSAQCSANFTYAVNANGNVTFSSTSIPGSSISTVYNWNYGNGSPSFSATGSAGMFPNTTYTTNGNYVVTLFIFSSIPSCTSTISYTINVNTVASGTCNLLANFTSTLGSNGLVNFNNTSTGTASTTTYFWNFGNGNTSNSTSPSNTYTTNGTYIATLTANNNFSSSCVSSKTLAIVVNNICNLTNVAQTYTTNGNGNYTFTWTPNVNAGFCSYSINWGNGNTGTGTSTINGSYSQTQNYASGIYTITAIVSAAPVQGCSVMVTQTINVTSGSGCNLVANFSASQAGNGLVNFNNTSSGTASTTTYMWNFGNGNTSTSTSPANTYTANGSYLVTMNATNNSTPACTSTKTLMVNVSNICNLNAGFNYTLGNNGSVSFANTSTGTQSNTTYLWNFGDNTTSNLANPSNHTYATGNYSVLLTITNFSTFPTCMDTVMRVISVTNTCVANANFTLTPTGTPKFWNAIPANTANISAAQWSWGDGSTSNTLFTSHLYSVSGTYTICLSTTVNCGASATYCSSYFIFKSTSGADNEMIRVDVIDASSVGIKNNRFENANISIYPNPNNGSFKISIDGLNEEVLKLSVYNLVGQLINETEVTPINGSVQKQIELEGLNNEGIYLINMSSANQNITRKITVLK